MGLLFLGYKCGLMIYLAITFTYLLLLLLLKISWEQDMVRRSDEFKNGCIPMHWVHL